MSTEIQILARSNILLSRALAYTKLADLDCARALAVEIRNHLDLINSYAMAKGIGMDLAEAQLNLLTAALPEYISDPRDEEPQGDSEITREMQNSIKGR